MSNFKNTGSQIYNQAIDENSTTQNAPLGTIIDAKDIDPTDYGVGQFIYLKGVLATGVASAVLYNQDDNSTTLLLESLLDGPVAFAMSACLASEFGWYQIFGKAVSQSAVAAIDDEAVFSTTTAGVVDDSGIIAVKNARTASAVGVPSAGLIELEIQIPYFAI